MKKPAEAPTLSDGIAVIGMQGRFPGARNVDELWLNLKNGVESIVTFSKGELRAAGIDPSYINVPGYVNRGCVLEDIELFDAGFFGYSARDAETMDPQQRLFMECAWEGLEIAGVNPDKYPGMIGVFAGSDQSSYLYQIYSSVDLSAYGYGGMMAIANDKDYLTTQVSYRLNLRGPSMAVQTSCSTSLVAVCIACQNLAHGYCDMALAGGVGISVPQKRGYWYQPGGIVSPDGHCRPFDANGQGTVVGNGVAIVVLKRLSEAIADGNHIHAVITGFALNNDGSAKVGYTAPSVDGQAQAIRRAQQMAGINPETIGYIETHGTATALGDPIEIAALTKAFSEKTKKRKYCAIGSLKSNTGHLSSASGIAGLIKGVLVVENGQIPKSLGYELPNPQIDFERSPFFVASELMNWPLKNGKRRRAGVSSFGVGGTNAHVVLEQAPKIKVDTYAPDKQLLLLSARTATALETATDNMAAYLENTPDLDLADAAFTTQVGRKAFTHRRAVVFHRTDREELVAALRTRDPRRVMSAQTTLQNRGVVFMFSGQGTQYVNMGVDLYENDVTFSGYLDECCDILEGEVGLDLRDVLYPEPRLEARASEHLKQTDLTQPALFAIEYALAKTWMDWGVTPSGMVGHSIGEYVAACLAQVMTLREALSIIALRGRLMSSMPHGSMLAVPLPEAVLQACLNPWLSLAAVNGPSFCVLSGPHEAIDLVEKGFREENVPCQRLHTSHAFHSSMMEPIVDEFVARMRRISLKAPQLPYLSNVTGSWITPELATSPEYWGHHIRQTVRFSDNLTEIFVFPDLAVIEVGPGRTLSTLARQQGSRASSQLFVSSLRAAQDPATVLDTEFLANAVGQLWLGGVDSNWHGFHAHEKRRIVRLPTYPFERQRFWIGPLEQVSETEAAVTAVATQTQELYGTVTVAGPTGVLLVNPPSAGDQTQVDLAGRFFAPTWKRTVRSGSAKQTPDVNESWLIFEDSNGVGNSVADQLRSKKRNVTTVTRGDSFGECDGGYQVRASEKADYEALLKALTEHKSYPTHILHSWSIDEEADSKSPVQSFAAAQEKSFFSLVCLAQALAKSGGARQVSIGIVTDSLHSVTGAEDLRSLEATISAAGRGIPQEYPHLRCRSIDVVASEEFAESLVRELTVEPFSPVVAYREGNRWVQEFDPVRLEAPQTKPDLLEDDGVYLITGGVGNIGLVLAKAIAQQVRAKLVLTSRSPFPAKAEWDTYVKMNIGDRTSQRIQKVKALEQLGAEVLVVQADVTNRGQMQTLIGDVKERWGKISGVIHGAANLTPAAFRHIGDIDKKNGDSHFQAKAHGLLILEELLREDQPRFVILLSSISSVLGGLGLTAYAAANAYLDAEAQRQNRKGETHWLSINWDAWDFTSVVTPPDAISATQGGEAFNRVIASALEQVVVAATALPARIDKWVKLTNIATAKVESVQTMAAVAASGNGAGIQTKPVTNQIHARPELTTQYAPPRTETEKKVTEAWEHLLGVAPIGIHDKFFELGGHSLLAIQLLAQLREVFSIDLPVQRLFEAPTVSQLSDSIDRDRVTVSETKIDENGEADDSLANMMKLVEGLSEEELDALLSEAEAMQAGE